MDTVSDGVDTLHQLTPRHRSMKSRRAAVAPKSASSASEPRSTAVRPNWSIQVLLCIILPLIALTLLVLYRTPYSKAKLQFLEKPSADELKQVTIEKAKRPSIYNFKIVNTYDHDPTSYTQGLQFERYCATNSSSSSCVDVFLESTGMYGESTVRRVSVQTGRILQVTNLNKRYFGEGLTRFGDRIYQLTWKKPLVLVYDANLEEVDQKTTELHDGWGMTTDGKEFIVSDGSSQLYWIDTETFRTQRRVTVTDGDHQIRHLNELEWINGTVWANIWFKDCIAIIDPNNGYVNGWVVLSALRSQVTHHTTQPLHRPEVLNGIAYDADQRRLFVTGKWWPLLFEIELVETGAEDDNILNSVRKTCSAT